MSRNEEPMCIKLTLTEWRVAQLRDNWGIAYSLMLSWFLTLSREIKYFRIICFPFIIYVSILSFLEPVIDFSCNSLPQCGQNDVAILCLSIMISGWISSTNGLSPSNEHVFSMHEYFTILPSVILTIILKRFLL